MRIKFICATIALSITSTGGASAGEIVCTKAPAQPTAEWNTACKDVINTPTNPTIVINIATEGMSALGSNLSTMLSPGESTTGITGIKIKIEKLIDQTEMKTINSQGITRTMYCNPKCTLGSPMLQSNSTGIDMGIPLVVYDGISEALIEAFGGENPFKKSQIIKLGISGYEEIAKTINDPNIKKAMAMPAEQLKQIKSQQRKTQANSNDNSGGSTAGGVAAEGRHEEDHHHHEEDHHEEAAME